MDGFGREKDIYTLGTGVKSSGTRAVWEGGRFERIYFAGGLFGLTLVDTIRLSYQLPRFGIVLEIT